MISNAPNINRLWADLLVEELIRCGVETFCLAPGSRSTPLVTAVADHPRARHTIHFDERGAAFFALGYARATGRPAVWITTSGTAVANGFPAVVEAAQDSLPLLLLTADRPPELRESAANQTIDQQKIFGGYVRWFFDLPAPDASMDPRFVLTTIDQAVHRAMTVPAGPVHVNCMFREPLAPTADGGDYGGYVDRLGAWNEGSDPYTRYARPGRMPDGSAIDRLASSLADVERGLLVVGRLPVGTHVQAILELTEALGWPLLPDISSQLRHAGGGGAVAALYHLVLGSDAFTSQLRPQAVIHLGSPVVSKRVARYVQPGLEGRYILVQNGPSRIDPEHLVTDRFDCEMVAFCMELAARVRPRRDSWQAMWTEAAETARTALVAGLGDGDELSEPWIGHAVADLLPPDAGIFYGSSMPIRDADMFSAASPSVSGQATAGRSVPVAANRGASGIDGTIASAVGFSVGLDAPVAVVLGDLALLHDLNSLAMVRTLQHPFVIVVINNDGGGIFSFLPIADHEAVFEPFFGTPHGLRFSQAAGMFGLNYDAPATRGEFQDALGAAFRRHGGSIIEVSTDRRSNVALHRELEEHVARAVGRMEAA